MAETFRNIAVSLSANVSSFKAQMAQAGAAVRTFSAEVQAASTEANRASRAAAQSFEDTASSASSLGKIMGVVGTTAAATGVAMGVKLAANLETSRVAFTGIIGSASEANDFITKLQDFAAHTPFTFVGVQKSTQQLLALGQTGDQAIQTLTTVGNAVSAVGGGEDAINGVVNAIAQIQGKGKLSAQELNQISNALPNLQRVQVYKVLADNLGITTDQAAALADQGKITADQGIGAILTAMQQVPGAAGAMERQSKTLSGVLSTLKDDLTIAAGEGFAPLAGAIRDAVLPLLTQLGDLLKGVMIPLGAGLSDVFKAVAQAFATLAPSLPGIAEAFGTLLSAAAQLVPPAAQLLNVVLVPLVPVLKMIADLLNGLLGIPGVIGALQALVVAWAALKAVQAVAIFQMMGGAAAAASVAIDEIGLAVGGAADALAMLPAAFGPVGLAIGALAAAMMILKPSATAAEAATVDFSDAIGKVGVEADKAIARIMATKLAQEGLTNTVAAAGVSYSSIKDAILGWASGTAEGTAKMQGLNDAVVAAMNSGVITKDEAGKLTQTIYDLAASYQTGTEKAQAIADAEDSLGVAGANAAAGQKAVADAINDAFNPITAYQAALKKSGDAAEQASQRAVDAIHKEYNARKDALALQERDEKDALDRDVAARKQALDDQLAAEKDGLDKQHQANLDAIDAKYQALLDGYDKEARARQDALDDAQRAEEEAIDKQVTAIKRGFEDQKSALDDTYEKQKAVLEETIKYSYGAQRDQAIQQLADLDKSHTDQTRALEDQQTDQVNTVKDAFDDRKRAQKEGLDDELGQLKQSISDKETAEKGAEDTRYNEIVAAFDARATKQKTALDNEVTDLQNHLTDKYNKLKSHLDDQESQAATAETTRRTNAKNAQTLSLSDYQAFLDDQTKKAKQFNADMAVIASQGGADVMTTVAKLPPALVAQAAKLGPAALTAFLDSIRASLAAGKTPEQIAAPYLPPPQRVVGLGPQVPQMVQAYGGITHTAQISRRPVLWAEAGPEAYIPLSWSKRATTTPILAQAASALGYGLTAMANGGILGATGGTSYVANVQVDARVAAGVDMNWAADVIGAKVQRGIDAAFANLQRQVTVRAWRN